MTRLKFLGESRFVAIATVFAALHVLLDSIPIYAFRESAVFLEPLEGIVLGPRLGVLTAVVGGTISRVVAGANMFSLVYGLAGESVGVATAGLLIKGKWRIVAAVYAFMLTAYFIHPYGMRLPLWTILDCLAAFTLVYPSALLTKNLLVGEIGVKRLTIAVPLVSFISTAAHSLTMVFIFIPVGLHRIEFGTFDAVYYAFTLGAAGSYLEDAIVLFVSTVVYLPVLLALRKSRIISIPLS